ncbi:beta-N-acetylhexosaminidase [Spongiactinospora sp. TRM90649]|uniref:beta-N-acetylhexosaminidase n=1 Tax=Spongiactinospora sp. TRM90649 TaxID=3031114 RepID=UPI0023F946EE|nr:beta-N-acetylhexosaminidase [Spongiactinospora sp. TRM90649]MDF5755516.1 beta-N-acetylhexosaminidase [Spongiactinospora sp. TRM90649]
MVKRWSTVRLTLAAVLVWAGGMTGCGADVRVEGAALVPLPASVVPAAEGEDFTLEPAVVITAPGEAAGVAEHLALAVQEATGQRPQAGPDGAIRLALTPGAGAEGYELVVGPDGVDLRAETTAGLFYGVQTLRQLLPQARDGGPSRMAGVRITDRPRFAWRGAMLDVARHFRPVADVKRYLDLMAAYKLNVLHLHLTDDQGWRLAIAGRPELTRIGGSTQVGGGPGGFYTADDYRELVKYASDRFIDIVPEIDMPGHTNAALASYAELNCDGRAREPYTGIEVGFSTLCVGSAATDRFVSDVIAEVARLTPGDYVHIGGDEVRELSEADYTRFVERAQELVVRAGKRMVAWQEVGKARLAPGSVVQYWQTREEPDDVVNAVRQGAKVVLSPASRVYLDMKYDSDSRVGQQWAGLVEVEDSYDWDPAALLPGVGEAAVLGVEAPLWTETVTNIDDLEYLAFPRLPAVAEVAWTPQKSRDFEVFASRLAGHAEMWRRWGVDFHESPQIPWGTTDPLTR